MSFHVVRTFFATFALPLLAIDPVRAQTVRTAAPSGLLRLEANTISGQAATLAMGTFAVDNLSAGAVVGASNGRKDNADYLALDTGKEWARPLRGIPSSVSFVSFQLCGSQTTIVDIAGVRLGLTAGPITGALQLMFDDTTTGTPPQWRELNYHVSSGKYGGKSMAALPTLTVRLDPVVGTWDLFAGSALIADNLPLIEAKKNDRQFIVRAGIEGAWISGLVFSDENPIYEDVNKNGIDDVFEKHQRSGSLLPANATKVERQLLAKQWKDAQRAKPPAAFFVQRPLPDTPIASAAPKR